MPGCFSYISVWELVIGWLAILAERLGVRAACPRGTQPTVLRAIASRFSNFNTENSAVSQAKLNKGLLALTGVMLGKLPRSANLVKSIDIINVQPLILLF